MSDLPIDGESALRPWLGVDHGQPRGPLLVLGGPGSGKTTLIATVASGLVQAHVPGGPQPLVLTFSRRAASDLRNRIARSIGRTILPPRVTTCHAFARAVVNRFADPDLPQMRLLTAPEQEYRVRELLLGGGPGRWPPDLAAAHGTRAFAQQVRAALARARQLGLDPEDLIAAGQAAGRPEWTALGGFFDEYLDVLDHEGSLDYAELVHRARIRLAEPEALAMLRAEVGDVLVDEYGELDPAQIGLLRALVPPGGPILAVGDPDQVIFGFRGAHPRGLAEFPQTFPTLTGDASPTLVQPGSHRLPPGVRRAVANLARRIPSRLTGAVAEQLRRPPDEVGETPATELDVVVCATETEQATFIAELIRRAHLEQGLGHGEMAVIVRSGRRQLAPIARALTAAGMPVEVAGDEIPLSAELAVRPLLLALEVVLSGGHCDADQARRLLTSPLAGFDAVSLRGLARWLTAQERADYGPGVPIRSGAELIAEALSDPDRLARAGTAEGDRLAEFAQLVRAALDTLARPGAGAGDVLWTLWSGTDWPQRLHADSAAGGEAGRLADRSLDAVAALFQAAGASAQPPGPTGVRGFLAEVAAQEIPADTDREAEVGGRGVRLLTAHRAKGLQWRLVVVAGLQEGVWPDPGRFGDILVPAQLVSDGLTGGVDRRGNLADERRLFLVACSRASQQLVVTAVAGADGEANQPSRFLTELGLPVRMHKPSAGPPLTLAGLTAELRRTATDEGVSAALRRAAIVRLAAVAVLRDASGRPAAPQADPERWWGVRPPTGGDLANHGPLRLSATQVSSLLSCPRRYVLARRAHAEPTRTAAAGIGSVVHVLAEHAGAEPITAEELTAELDRVWQQLPLGPGWLSASERVEAELALTRFVNWRDANQHAEVVGVELPFEFTLDLPGGTVTLVGAVDRLERTAQGSLRVVDFKTGRRAPTRAEAAVNEQLGLYQLAIQEGAFEQATGSRVSAGGVLVYLRRPDSAEDYPKQFHQAPLHEVPHPEPGSATQGWPTWVHQRVADAAQVVREGAYPATPGEGCRWCPFSSSCPAQPAGRQVV